MLTAILNGWSCSDSTWCDTSDGKVPMDMVRHSRWQVALGDYKRLRNSWELDLWLACKRRWDLGGLSGSAMAFVLMLAFT